MNVKTEIEDFVPKKNGFSYQPQGGSFFLIFTVLNERKNIILIKQHENGVFQHNMSLLSAGRMPCGKRAVPGMLHIRRTEALERKDMRGIGMIEKIKQKIADAAPFDRGSLFFSESDRAFDSAGADGHLVCDHIRVFAAENAEKAENSQADRSPSAADPGRRYPCGAAVDIIFLDRGESARTDEGTGFTGDRIVSVCT